MYYVVNDVEAATREGLADTVRRALDEGFTCLDLDVVPYTEKGKPSEKYMPFKIRVFNYPRDWQEVWVYGFDKHAYFCAVAMREPLENNGIPVFFKRLASN